jgi:hypothetical protein
MHRHDYHQVWQMLSPIHCSQEHHSINCTHAVPALQNCTADATIMLSQGSPNTMHIHKCCHNGERVQTPQALLLH